ncbi:prolipoprotein diacylglyceryl transferase family protein [Maribacter chungangensis]|uniref:Prolipoprotein diacylglyceryl transferase family protein n=1 Tax=Maribacter chungangensis TaxID=1069117 RepID=A0ABW3BBD6_9FLAO
MSIPYEPVFLGVPFNMHLILEYLAFFVAFRYYLYLRKNSKDNISSTNRLSIIIGAVFGALICSRLIAFMENPIVHYDQGWMTTVNNKTIMGGLFGGLLGVELVKKIIGEKQSSGDLFTLPIILGIIIGRVGCFLAGTTEFTYGKSTTFFLGMDLGDGLLRHPIALYEVVFLLLLFFGIKVLQKQSEKFKDGDYFKLFMVAYFGFRFAIEFLKPNAFFVLGLSSIQLLCLICWAYYYKFIYQIAINAQK